MFRGARDIETEAESAKVMRRAVALVPLALEERASADLEIEPPIPEHNDMSPAMLKAMVDAGERGAMEALPKLRRLFERA